MKSEREVKAEFDYRGESIAAWARREGYKLQTVYDVINGRQKARRGLSHDIAVKLGMKNGVLRDAR